MNYYSRDTFYSPFIWESFSIDASKIAFAGKNSGGDLGYSQIEVDDNQGLKINRPAGKYVSFEPVIDFYTEESAKRKMINALSGAIESLNGGPLENVLVVGLGNARITADSLGSEATKNLDKEKNIKFLLPDVGGVTGVDSFDLVSGICEKIKPSVVVVVDSLSSENIARLGRSFQLTDSGISAGSGVGSGAKILSAKSLSTKVIAIGVPLVMYAKKICPSASVPSETVLTLSNVDYLVKDLGFIIGSAINQAA